MSGTARLLLGIALSAAFTGCVVRHSGRHLRLARPPEYDDVAYFADAARRVALLEGMKDLGVFVRDCFSSPPHSPLSAALGVAAFAIFGFKDWAPYAVNGILVLALLAMVDYLFRRRSLPVRAAMAALALALPWASMLVYEFKPDAACALMMGFGLALAFEDDLLRATLWRRCAVGVAFGIAVLCKPSFFVFAAALTVATFVASLLVGPWRFRETFKAWLWVVAAMLAVGGLPLALRPRYYLNYLWMGLFLPPVPRHPGGWKDQAIYYLWGVSDYLMRGQHLLILCGAVAAAAVVLARQGRWDRVRLVLAPLIPVAAAYLIPTLSAVKHPDFGVMFAAMLSFAALRALAELSPPHGTALAFTVTLFGLWCAKPPPVWPPPPSGLDQRWGLVNQAYGAVRERLYRPGVRIFVTAPGLISPDLLVYYAVRDGLKPPQAASGGLGTAEETTQFLEWADIVIAPSPDAAGVSPHSARAFVRADALAAARVNASFAPFGTIEDPEGGAYYFFERIGRWHR